MSWLKEAANTLKQRFQEEERQKEELNNRRRVEKDRIADKNRKEAAAKQQQREYFQEALSTFNLRGLLQDVKREVWRKGEIKETDHSIRLTFSYPGLVCEQIAEGRGRFMGAHGPPKLTTRYETIEIGIPDPIINENVITVNRQIDVRSRFQFRTRIPFDDKSQEKLQQALIIDSNQRIQQRFLPSDLKVRGRERAFD